MKAIMEKRIKIESSMCDNKGVISIPSLFASFIDMACEHAPLLGMGAPELAKQDLFWVAVRTKIKIHNRPAMLKEVLGATWPETPERIRCNRYYTLKDENGLLAEGKTEWAIINFKTGRPARLSEIYNNSIEHSEEKACEIPFARVGEDFSDCSKIGEYTVKSTDIDIGQHMNNVAYIRALMGFFSCKELENFNFSEIDIAYRNQCYEGELLTLFERKADDCLEFGFFKTDGKVAATARLI